MLGQKRKFTILGERCSGTNFLELALVRNFNVDCVWDYERKHFFGFYDYAGDKSCDDVIFVGIVRHPVEWIHSFWEKKWHIAPHLRTCKNAFVTGEFWSYHDSKDEDGSEIMEDRNIESGGATRYKNIFELREVKSLFLLKAMPKLVKNYILIRYEDLLEKYAETLDTIRDKFGLEYGGGEYLRVETYKKAGWLYKPKEYKRHQEREIHLGINWEVEKELGYFMEGDKKNI